MTSTVVAIYDDIVAARQVVEDLVKAGFTRSTISLITNDANNQYSRYLDKDYAPKDDAVTAGEGAGFGAVVGALTGVLVGLAALMIPGIGLAIVAGPIVAGLTGAVAGALTGGVVGALVKSGVPEDDAPYYAEGIRRGGTLISIETSDTLRAEDIMNRVGAINIHERINGWRQAGWKGFDSEVVENVDVVKSPVEPLTAVTNPEITPVLGTASPLVAPVVDPDPQINVDDEDTAEFRAVRVTAPSTEMIIPDTIPDAPVLLVVEEEPHVQHEDTTK